MVAVDGRSYIHLSACAIVGVALRVLLDLWFQQSITNNGRTNEYGGAMFADLPANMVGSFFVGMLTVSFINRRFQKHILLAWKTGFCGSLTTFASWNTQMVVMMEGSVNTYLQSQIGSALFGYLIGFQLALVSFQTGKHFAIYLQHHYDNDNSPTTTSNKEEIKDQVDEETTMHYSRSSRTQQDQNVQLNNAIIETPANEINALEQTKTDVGGNKFKILEVVLNNVSIVLSIAVIIIFIYLDVQNLRTNPPIQRNLFYQKMWLSFLFAPIGAILRWKLSTYNSVKKTTQIQKENVMTKKMCHNFPPWFPYGTFYANILGSIISILAVGFLDRFLLVKNSSDSTRLSGLKESLLQTCLGAIKTGFAGCLSTVSTFISEVDGLFEKYPNEPKGYIYGFLSIGFASIISLCIYAPLLRAF